MYGKKKLEAGTADLPKGVATGGRALSRKAGAIKAAKPALGRAKAAAPKAIGMGTGKLAKPVKMSQGQAMAKGIERAMDKFRK